MHQKLLHPLSYLAIANVADLLPRDEVLRHPLPRCIALHSMGVPRYQWLQCTSSTIDQFVEHNRLTRSNRLVQCRQTLALHARQPVSTDAVQTLQA